MARAERRSGDLAALNGLNNAHASSVPVRRGRVAKPSHPVSQSPVHVYGERRAPVQSRSRLGFRTVLRNPHFLRLWMAQLISQTIMNAANYGIIILIATQSKSVTATGAAIAIFSLPAALFAAPAGVYVDRMDKRRVLWMSNALRALLSFGFVLTLWINSTALLPVYGLIFLIALVGQFFAPAEGAAIPLLVHEDELVNALALFNITFTLSQALGLIALGPLVIALVPAYSLGTFFGHHLAMSQPQSLFAIVGVLFAVCAILVATIPHHLLAKRVRADQAHVQRHDRARLQGVWAGISEVWTFVRRDHTLFAAVLQLSLAGTVVSVIGEIAPRFVNVFFALPEQYAALVFIPAGAGLILGSIALPHIIKRQRRSSLLVSIGIVVLAACTLALTFMHSVATHVGPNEWSRSPLYFVGVLLLTFVMGVALDLLNIPAQTTMQEMSPDWIKGRVLALQNMLYNAVTVPTVFLIGIVADYFNLPPAMNVLAIVVLGAGFLTIWYGRRPHRAPLVIQRAPSAPRAAEPAFELTSTMAGPPAALDNPQTESRNGYHAPAEGPTQPRQRAARKRRKPRQPTGPVG
jgi:MFS family permease